MIPFEDTENIKRLFITILSGFMILTGIMLVVSKFYKDNDTALTNQYFVESKLGFYDPLDKDFTINKWIRKPENIRTVHETFKKYGYTNIFSDNDLTSNPCMIWSYINKPCVNIIDSLILTYPKKDISTKYYKEFWERREKEGNDTTVFAILKEIKEVLINRKRIDFNDRLTNDTIYNLIRIKYKRPIDNQEAQNNFDYLVKIGLNLSAYNMLFEWTMYENIKWDKENLKKKLKTDTLSSFVDPIIEDNTK
jgi:hypothetical protein